MDAFNEGIDAYFAWKNEEGGIYGRQLVLADKIDDEFGLNQAKALEIVGANNRFGVFVATLIFMGAAELNDAGIPTYVWNIHPNEMAGRNNLFGNAGTGCVGCTSRVVPYLANLAGAKKVAAVGYGASENSKTCTQTQAKSIEKYSADLGVEVAYLNDNLAFGLPNGIGPEVTAMKDAGVEFITTCIDLNGMKTLAQELSRQRSRLSVASNGPTDAPRKSHPRCECTQLNVLDAILRRQISHPRSGLNVQYNERNLPNNDLAGAK